MSEGGEALIIDENLESVRLVDDCQIEANSLFEGNLSFTFFIAPFPGLEGISNDMLLTESWIEVKSNVSISTKKVDVEALCFLFRSSENEEFLSWSESSADS